MTALLSSIPALWAARTGREQVMTLALAGLLLAWLVQTLLVGPLLDVHERARREYAAAVEQHREIREGLADYAVLPAANPGSNEASRPLRTIVGAAATSRRIAIAGIVPGVDGRLSVHIDRADYGAAMGWLIEMERRYGIEVMSITMARLGRDQVELNLVLTRAGN
ncbi:type II secretion system protein GspM [Maricaulis salignorans]|uniref:General secretion pathway protein M n=1 Tax=Maricaulis salignorans TaxID=144026 RepID=A0A1G9LUL5_9PROT|nr:type II secretion system protein GspM [Maricaulis salignorans]SDL65441.1 general secretion pathway protein M [Maricaulis salignorans]